MRKIRAPSKSFLLRRTSEWDALWLHFGMTWNLHDWGVGIRLETWPKYHCLGVHVGTAYFYVRLTG
jgi:hypothetical protein